ncbi:MAG TPA: hypothetical protein ENK09_07985 [Nitrospirae bacterium]|nr:hypothetical protein [Nitrospirota bacterium]
MMSEVRRLDYSQAWWAELEDLSTRDNSLNWCCKLIRECGFEEFIQNEIGIYVGLRFRANYCPHCGKLLREKAPSVFSKACCWLFRDIGLEGMQYEEKVLDEDGSVNTLVHRLIMRYCFHCGAPVKRKKDGDDGCPEGENLCSCGGCE